MPTRQVETGALLKKAFLGTRRHASPHLRCRALVVTGAVAVGFVAYFSLRQKSQSVPTSANVRLSPSHFTPATLTLSQVSGPNTKLLTLAIPSHLLSSPDALLPIWSIYIKDDEMQVERPYTPIEGLDKKGQMTFWIKKYPNGEVGRWLHSKNVGTIVEVRGPVKNWIWRDGVWDEVVMISGGTGITPFCQLLHTLFAGDKQYSSNTRFTLLHFSRTSADLPPSMILRPLLTRAKQHPQHFRMHLFVDSTQVDDTHSHGYPPNIGRVSKEVIQRYGLGQTGSSGWQKLFRYAKTASARNRKVLFLVCGPDQMINAVAGPFGRNLSQGEIGGILGELGYSSSQVWKL